MLMDAEDNAKFFLCPSSRHRIKHPEYPKRLCAEGRFGNTCFSECGMPCIFAMAHPLKTVNEKEAYICHQPDRYKLPFVHAQPE